MNLTDPVADFLTRIRNAHGARHQKLDVPASKLKAEVARILKEEGYISNVKPVEEEGRQTASRVPEVWREQRAGDSRFEASFEAGMPCVRGQG